MPYRVGVQTAEPLWASVNRTPSLAIESICGVGTIESGLLQPTSP